MCQVTLLVYPAMSPVLSSMAFFPTHQVPAQAWPSDHPGLSPDFLSKTTIKCIQRNATSILLPMGTSGPICYWLPNPSHAQSEVVPSEFWLLENPPGFLGPASFLSFPPPQSWELNPGPTTELSPQPPRACFISGHLFCIVDFLLFSSTPWEVPVPNPSPCNVLHPN